MDHRVIDLLELEGFRSYHINWKLISVLGFVDADDLGV